MEGSERGRALLERCTWWQFERGKLRSTVALLGMRQSNILIQLGNPEHIYENVNPERKSWWPIVSLSVCASNHCVHLKEIWEWKDKCIPPRFRSGVFHIRGQRLQTIIIFRFVPHIYIYTYYNTIWYNHQLTWIQTTIITKASLLAGVGFSFRNVLGAVPGKRQWSFTSKVSGWCESFTRRAPQKMLKTLVQRSFLN